MKNRKKLIHNVKRFLPLYIMTLPALLYLLINNYMPMPGLVLAFKSFNAQKGIYGSPWAGFKNFAFLIQSREFPIILRANIPGIICDGAKISCAAKIASSLDASMMAHYLAMQNKEYEAYTGILKEDAGETISCVGYIGKVGMHQTDKEIIKMMLK